jgi:hypothetical protein
MLPSNKLSSWVSSVLPNFLLKPVKATYTVYYRWFMRRVKRRQEKIASVLFQERPARVSEGPFKGMRYVGVSAYGSLITQLVGSYEAELGGVIEKIVAHGYDRILDIGCSEGYYAVGLAMRSPRTIVFAYDITEEAGRLCSEMAKMNGVADRVIFSGACNPAKLNEMIQGETVIVSDCEGYELELLDPNKMPRLANADILVELHRAADPKVSVRDVLSKRFEKSHSGQIIHKAEKDSSQYPILKKIPAKDRKIAVSEFRTGTDEWGWWERKR